MIAGGDSRGADLYKIIAGAFKIAVASLLTGAGLSFFDLTAGEVLAQIGLTPERLIAIAEKGAAWAAPNLLLGSMVIVPIWLVVTLLRPPRG